MKKFVAMTALAVVLAGAAHAESASNATTTNAATTNANSTTTMYHPPASRRIVGSTDTVQDIDFTGMYPLQDGNTLKVVGQTAWLVTPSGFKYYAPNASYVTTRGETFFTESGQILRMEAPPKVVAVDTNHIGRRGY